ncbi:MAG: rRNA maturation RNase YbeY [Candidatus Paceibacterota bacterium]|jgi:probable rRNA maturation factor
MRFESKIKHLKKDILGKKYSLSIAYVTPKKSRELNKQYRKKDKATNVLSFSLRKNEGELVLCKTVIKKEARNSDRTFEEWLEFLVIHGMLHLKGFEHGKKMEKMEKKYLSHTKFFIK